MSELPEGWVNVLLSDIAQWGSGGTPSRANSAYYSGSIPWVKTGELGQGSIENTKEKITELGLQNSSAKIYPAGSVLIAMYGATTGKTAILGVDAATNQACAAGIPMKNITTTKYLFYYLSSQRDVFIDAGKGGAQPNISLEVIKNWAIPLAPFKQQKRIVDKLDSLLAQVNACQKRLDRVSLILKRFRQSVLVAAISGQLTKDWRELNSSLIDATADALALRNAHIEAGGHKRGNAANPTEQVHDLKMEMFPNSWQLVELRDIVRPDKPITYGILKPGPQIENGIPYIRVSDFPNNKLNTDNIRKTSKTIDADFSRSSLAAGDILLSIRGTVGRLVVVPPELAKANITQDSARLSIQDIVKQRYLFWFLHSELAQTRMKRAEKGVAVRGINIGDVRALQIPLPSRYEQQEIVHRIEALFSHADRIETLHRNACDRIERLIPKLLDKAFRGELVPQDPNDEPASILLEKIQAEKSRIESEEKTTRTFRRSNKENVKIPMKKSSDYLEALRSTIKILDNPPDARQLFDRAGFKQEETVQFYEALREIPEIRTAFEISKPIPPPQIPSETIEDARSVEQGSFRLIELWLEDFKNLTDYTVRFDPAHSIDVVLGWNGTGKSNLFEALVIIFRDLHRWWEKNQWTQKPMNGYRLRYEIDGEVVEVVWQPSDMKRPKLKSGKLLVGNHQPEKLENIKREKLLLPRFIFGYYSGPTNRLAEHFLTMKQEHYVRLRDATSDDPNVLNLLLEQRRFFCAENHHAKYVLLAFFHKEDDKINQFLHERLRIMGFESALFIIRKPRWAKTGQTAETFWGATGIMRRVMERLQKFALAPMLLKQTVPDGFRSREEEHYYFFLPDLQSLHAFAAEYQDARTFFLALESIDFSELIYDVKIQVRVKATEREEVGIAFHELSEGEQQLLMVLGLMRFTKSNQSLVLLDEPDTHLNPHWSVDYLKLLARVMSEDSNESEEQQTSQILMSTHDPLVIASLFKEQIHLLKRDWQTGICKWGQPSIDPRGLGFTGILTSEMFGMRSDLDEETLADLDSKVRIIAQEGSLTPEEEKELEKINQRLEDAGFQKAFSDPYYAAFIRAWSRHHSDLMAGIQFVSPEKQAEIDQIAREVLEESIAELQAEAMN